MSVNFKWNLDTEQLSSHFCSKSLL